MLTIQLQKREKCKHKSDTYTASSGKKLNFLTVLSSLVHLIKVDMCTSTCITLECYFKNNFIHGFGPCI
jgi:hypothetical protein